MAAKEIYKTGSTMEVEPVAEETVIDKDIAPTTKSGDGASPKAKRRKRRKADAGESEVATSKQFTIMDVTKVDVSRTEIFYAVRYLKSSKLEKEILLTDGITEVELDPETPDLGFVLLKNSI